MSANDDFLIDGRPASDLRVVDLKELLEKRCLSKSGSKSVLLHRLKESLNAQKTQEEPSVAEKDPNFVPNMEFESFADPVAENGDLSGNETTGSVPQNDAKQKEEELVFDDDSNTAIDDGQGHQEMEVSQNDEDDDEALTIDDVDMESGSVKADNGDFEPSIDFSASVAHIMDNDPIIDEQKSEADESLSLADDHLLDIDVNHITSSMANVIQEEDDEIPNPEQVEPPCMFTAEDTIRLHEAAVEKEMARNEPITDETSSMYVNADESLSELNGATPLVVQLANQTKETAADGNSANSSEDSDNITSNNNNDEGDKDLALTDHCAAKERVETASAGGLTTGLAATGTADSVEVKTISSTKIDEKKEHHHESKGSSQANVDSVKNAASKDVAKKIEDKHPEACMWVSGIPTTIKATDLKSLFSKYGRVVTAKVVKLKSKGSIQWYGNITMSSADEASKCITHLHRTELKGKSISIEKGGGAFPPKKMTAATIPSSNSTTAPVDVSTTQKEIISSGQDKTTIKSVESAPTLAKSSEETAAPADSTTETAKPASVATTVKGKKTPPKDSASTAEAQKADGKIDSQNKKKPEGMKGEKAKEKEKEKDDKRARSTSKSTRSHDRANQSSKEKRPYRDTRREATTRAAVSAARRRIVASRPYPSYNSSRISRGGFRGSRGGYTRGAPFNRMSRGVPPLMRSSYSRGGSQSSSYRPPPPPPAPAVDFRRQREEEMIERMRRKEMEYRQREDMLRLQREKERLKWEREKLEREKLEIQQMRMQAAYERSAVYASPHLMAVGVKRAYEGLDPYAAQSEPKRPNYGTPSTPQQSNNAASRSSSRRTPPKSYPSRNSDSYRSGANNTSSRYDSRSSSSRNARQSGPDTSSSSYRNVARRSGPPPRTTRGSRYSSPPPTTSRRNGGQQSQAAAQGSLQTSASRNSWGGSGGNRQSLGGAAPGGYTQGRSSGSSSNIAVVSSGSSLGQMNAWPPQSGALAAATTQWRAMAGGAQLYSVSPGGNVPIYAMNPPQSNSYTPATVDRFDAYKYSTSSSKRY